MIPFCGSEVYLQVYDIFWEGRLYISGTEQLNGVCGFTGENQTWIHGDERPVRNKRL